jgi:hypothetical protein
MAPRGRVLRDELTLAARLEEVEELEESIEPAVGPHHPLVPSN